MKTLNRLSQFSSDLVTRGLLYAIANYRIHTPLPLEADENWDFWTRPRSSWFEYLSRAYPPEFKRKAYLEAMLMQSHAEGIEAHYDISNEFYALFLDTKYQFYSCAEFLSDEETIEQAQENKAKYLLSLLNLSGHEKVLDLGCGWGAMMRFLRDSGHCGELNGLTLSREQLTYNQKLGLKVFLTNFISDPWENAPYERILSIGALEHVRPKELRSVYQKIYDALAPEGLAVHQFFSFEREPYPALAILLQIFFPGSLLAMHRDHIEAAESVGFKISHDSVHDYKPTLRAWYERLIANQEKALSIVSLEVFNRYMTFFPVAWLFFDYGEARLHRIVMEKSSNLIAS